MEQCLQLNDASSFVQIALESIEIEESHDLEKSVVDRLKLEKLKEVLTKSISFISARLVSNAKQEVAAKTKLGDTLLEIDDVQFFEPRGRFKLIISTDTLMLEGKQFSCMAALDNISHIACIPSNCSSKKEGEDFLAIRFTTPVKINNKDVKQILGNLSKSPLKMTAAVNGVKELETAVVTTVLRKATGLKVVRPQKHLFQTMAQQKEYLRCYKGIQEGAIYPLESGVVFVKPLLFIPAEEISSITAGRGGGAGNTKYIDLKIETADDREFEFTNIEREELAALQLYVKGYLEARTKAAETSAASSSSATSSKKQSSGAGSASGSEVIDLETGPPTAAPAQQDEDDDSSDDDDYSPSGSSDEDGSGDSSDSNSDSDSDSDGSSDDDAQRSRSNKKSSKSARGEDESDSDSAAGRSGDKKAVPAKKTTQKKQGKSKSERSAAVAAGSLCKGGSKVSPVSLDEDCALVKSEGAAVIDMTSNNSSSSSVGKKEGRKQSGDCIKRHTAVSGKVTARVVTDISADDNGADRNSVKRDREDIEPSSTDEQQRVKKERVEIEL